MPKRKATDFDTAATVIRRFWKASASTPVLVRRYLACLRRHDVVSLPRLPVERAMVILHDAHVASASRACFARFDTLSRSSNGNHALTGFLFGAPFLGLLVRQACYASSWYSDPMGTEYDAYTAACELFSCFNELCALAVAPHSSGTWVECLQRLNPLVHKYALIFSSEDACTATIALRMSFFAEMNIYAHDRDVDISALVVNYVEELHLQRRHLRKRWDFDTIAQVLLDVRLRADARDAPPTYMSAEHTQHAMLLDRDFREPSVDMGACMYGFWRRMRTQLGASPPCFTTTLNWLVILNQRLRRIAHMPAGGAGEWRTHIEQELAMCIDIDDLRLRVSQRRFDLPQLRLLLARLAAVVRLTRDPQRDDDDDRKWAVIERTLSVRPDTLCAAMQFIYTGVCNARIDFKNAEWQARANFVAFTGRAAERTAFDTSVERGCGVDRTVAWLSAAVKRLYGRGSCCHPQRAHSYAVLRLVMERGDELLPEKDYPETLELDARRLRELRGLFLGTLRAEIAMETIQSLHAVPAHASEDVLRDAVVRAFAPPMQLSGSFACVDDALRAAATPSSRRCDVMREVRAAVRRGRADRSAMARLWSTSAAGLELQHIIDLNYSVHTHRYAAVVAQTLREVNEA